MDKFNLIAGARRAMERAVMDSVPVNSRAWRSMLAQAALAFVGLVGLTAAFLLAFDPYGAAPWSGGKPPALMDLNQRFMYPQVVRSHRFDSAVFGTSTIRLLNPDRIDQLFGVRSANLAMNSATAWEQSRIADLFLRETPHPKLIIMGLDPLWCEEDADSPAKRLTFRAFPDSFYDDNRWNDWPHLFNLKGLEVAWRLAAHQFGLMRERLGANGYEVFTPPESQYDLQKARSHIYEGGGPQSALRPPVQVSGEQRASWRFPALDWLSSLLGRLPPETRAVLVFPPRHVNGQDAEGSLGKARDAECKARVAKVAAGRATVVDFRFPSAITRRDENFWDSLHYRLPIAERIATGLHEAVKGGGDRDGGVYHVLETARAVN
ncbi:hypothetical protein SLNSH_17325 [Alsobacter soli]|uniref:Uncharacterized protein n=1 Tax=Alsobacter soli TaxID=2109933 RepID=A0A2T1HPZ3_9HYPH|nr:hypothetical protein [Alsobacter soli]PSC03706.1 hypothetical protein SLNSH_17325 [Alsobacter soli]